jgi:hypothetical protein
MNDFEQIPFSFISVQSPLCRTVDEAANRSASLGGNPGSISDHVM